MFQPDLEVHFSRRKVDWESPKWLFKKLTNEFSFTLDVCADRYNYKVSNYFNKSTNGLIQDWGGNVCWMNPPYAQPENPCKPNCKKKICKSRGWHNKEYRPGIIDWVKKARDESRKPGTTVVCLLPARTNHTWWHKYVWDEERHKPYAGVQVRFIKGKLTFEGAEHPAPFPSVIVIFGVDVDGTAGQTVL